MKIPIHQKINVLWTEQRHFSSAVSSVLSVRFWPDCYSMFDLSKDDAKTLTSGNADFHRNFCWQQSVFTIKSPSMAVVVRLCWLQVLQMRFIACNWIQIRGICCRDPAQSLFIIAGPCQVYGVTASVVSVLFCGTVYVRITLFWLFKILIAKRGVAKLTPLSVILLSFCTKQNRGIFLIWRTLIKISVLFHIQIDMFCPF